MRTMADLYAAGFTVKDGVAVRVGSGMAEVACQGESARTQPSSSASKGATASPYRSKWEEERAEMLAAYKRMGTIRDWRYEGIRLRLADGAWYKPDFVIVHNDGLIELEEVKGHWREAARVRWKVAVEQFRPMFTLSLTTKRAGAWVTVEYHPRAA